MNPYYDPNSHNNIYNQVNPNTRGAYTPPPQNGFVAPNGFVPPQGYAPNQYPQGYNPYPVQQPQYQQPPVNRPTPEQVARYQKAVFERNKEKHDIIVKGVILGATIIFYLLIQVVIISLLQRTKYFDIYNSSSLFQNCFNIVTVHLCAMLIPYSLMVFILRKKSVRPVVPTSKVKPLTLISWVFVGLGVSMAGNAITNVIIELTKLLGYELSTPDMIKAASLPEYIALIASTIIAPAIFEEYAFRCCSMSVLRTHGKAFAVIAASIIFGISHGNAIQFIFAFVVGCALGYITLKTNSIIPAMLIHALTNSMSVVNEIVTAEANKKTADTVVMVMAGVYIAGAIAGIIYLYFKKDLLLPKEQKPKNPLALTLWNKLVLLLPGLAIPFIILISLSSQFIKKM